MPTVLRNHYVLAVPNAEQSADFFIRGLGFGVHSKPPGWVFVIRDQCLIMLGECPNDLPAQQIGCHAYFAYLRVDDVSAFRAQIESTYPGCCGNIADRPWGMREFHVTAPDGHRLMIGQIIGG